MKLVDQINFNEFGSISTELNEFFMGLLTRHSGKFDNL